MVVVKKKEKGMRCDAMRCKGERRGGKGGNGGTPGEGKERRVVGIIITDF